MLFKAMLLFVVVVILIFILLLLVATYISSNCHWFSGKQCFCCCIMSTCCHLKAHSCCYLYIYELLLLYIYSQTAAAFTLLLALIQYMLLHHVWPGVAWRQLRQQAYGLCWIDVLSPTTWLLGMHSGLRWLYAAPQWAKLPRNFDFLKIWNISYFKAFFISYNKICIKCFFKISTRHINLLFT